jgi:tRNA-2-methylthio-N6-dimethylallyladenosine synthase
VLKAMNRSHSRDSYLRLLDRIRAARPTSRCRATSSSAFPRDRGRVAETLSLVDAVGYAQAFSFKYSARPGTPAAGLPDQIAPEVMTRASSACRQRSAATSTPQPASVGRTCAVLVERRGKLPGQMLGKSPWLQSVHLLTDAPIGTLVEATLTDAGPNSLAGMERLRVAA